MQKLDPEGGLGLHGCPGNLSKSLEWKAKNFKLKKA